MGLNTRKSQIISALIPIFSVGLLLEAPFAWRALKTKKQSDIRAAIVFGVLQVAVYVAFAIDNSPKADQVSNLTGSVVWGCAFAAAFAAAWLFRPLNKEEQMDQARSEQRSGSSFL
ncbi:hypothetical protein ACFW2V_13905 [Streptomyces sp. NPDC058947]|uniref:hypothetical protein n=1 Tax=Streptomyces sp. NPDC058947 TaxID=3346675 RepID=UPI0036C6D3FF